MNGFTLQHCRNGQHIEHGGVCAGADADLIDRHALKLGNGLYVIGAVRTCGKGNELRKIDGIFRVVDGVRVGGKLCKISFSFFCREECCGDLVSGEDGGGGAELGAHIGDGGSLRNGECLYALASVFHDGTDTALYAEKTENLKNDVLCADIIGKLACKIDVNDFGHGDAPMGDKNSRDAYTFYGGLRNLVETLLAKYNREIICFILPLHRLDEELNGRRLIDYVAAIKEIVTEYGIACLDLYNNGLSKPYNEEDDTYFTDGLHPNDLGHSIIADKICEYLGVATVTEL